MMSRRAIAITCLLASVLSSCGPSKDEVYRIEWVLAQDQSISGQYERNEITYDQIPGLMQDIDTSGCPTPFREAYLRHCQAWSGFARIVAKENDPNMAVEAVFRMLAGQPDGGVTQHMDERQRRDDEVTDTWNQVQLLAVRYGALLPSQK